LSGGTSGELITDYQGAKWEVVDSYYVVSIIDASSPSSPTYNQEIGTIRLYGGAADLAVSPDGKRLYVDQGDGKTVTVIDTTTNKVIGVFATDQNSATGVRSIAVAPNGSLYVTDAADGKVYVVTV
jgi:YVTN family beta-propeller protein